MVGGPFDASEDRLPSVAHRELQPYRGRGTRSTRLTHGLPEWLPPATLSLPVMLPGRFARWLALSPAWSGAAPVAARSSCGFADRRW